MFTSEKIIKFYKILFELVNTDRWKKILKMDDNEAKKYFNSLLERKMDSLDDKRKQIIRECFEGLLLNLFLESKDMVYQKFLKRK